MGVSVLGSLKIIDKSISGGQVCLLGTSEWQIIHN